MSLQGLGGLTAIFWTLKQYEERFCKTGEVLDEWSLLFNALTVSKSWDSIYIPSPVTKRPTYLTWLLKKKNFWTDIYSMFSHLASLLLNFLIQGFWYRVIAFLNWNVIHKILKWRLYTPSLQGNVYYKLYSPNVSLVIGKYIIFLKQNLPYILLLLFIRARSTGGCHFSLALQWLCSLSVRNSSSVELSWVEHKNAPFSQSSIL